MSRNLSNIELKQLANKVLKGTASEEEHKLLNNWYAAFDDSEVLLETEESKEELRSRLLSRIRVQIAGVHRPERKSLHVLWKAAAAISLLLVSIASVYFINRNAGGSADQGVPVAIESKATTWSQKRTLQLPDGTIVKLNSGSSIKYPKHFQDDKRQVELVGEAFFDVVRNEAKPFVIQTGEIEVEVLGTSFNVRSHAGEPQVDVAVRTGKVRVTSSTTAESVTLLPDEMATYATSSQVMQKKRIADREVVFGWVEGNLVFRDQDFQTVITMLSRWYGVEFEIKGNPDLAKKITANCGNHSLREVLESLSHNYEFEYEINEKVITIR